MSNTVEADGVTGTGGDGVIDWHADMNFETPCTDFIVLDAAVEVADTVAPATLLECEGHRWRFYAGSGFRPVAEIPDPLGPPALLMRRDRP